MKQTIYTLLLLTVISFISCKKSQVQPTINQYDEEQIKAYISTNKLTGMLRDTSGIYYQILTPGTGATVQYTDSIGFVYTNQSFDGKYISADTIVNHYEDYMGHIQAHGFPLGVQEAVHNLINRRGGRIRLLIPSHLAYGVEGNGSGSSTVTNGRIAGNQCLDYYVNIMNDQNAYDQMVIKNYIVANGLSNGMTYDPQLNIWVLISTPGTGTDPITDDSTVGATFTLRELNNTIIDQYNTAGGTAIELPDLIKGMQLGLKKYGTTGALMMFLIPSSLGTGTQVNGAAPPNSCLRYEIQIDDVSP
jgi:FKBP-type peptidyl-prolyl cis-trans isomerase FkpA